MPKSRPGELNCKAKLTADDVRAIRRSPLTHKAIAHIYGVSYFTVWDIRTRKTWKHIDNPMDVPCYTSQDDPWRPVVGLEEKYEVSRQGYVRSRRPYAHLPRRTLRLWLTRAGYIRVILSVNGKTKHQFVHRLVMEAFVGPVPPRHQVNHKDGDKTNNSLSNLEYVTCLENQRHASRMRLRAFGERNSHAKITADIAMTIYRSDEPASALAERFGLSRTQVYFIKWKKAWPHIHDDPSSPST